MLTAEKNRLITETDPGTLCGALMRRYWQPAALVEELDAPRPAKRLRLLGEDLVLFRDPSGRYGLLDRRCAHRGADLSFGRCESVAARCLARAAHFYRVSASSHGAAHTSKVVR